MDLSLSLDQILVMNSPAELNALSASTGLTRDSESHLATQHMASSIWRDIYSDFLLWRELNGDRNT